MENGTSPLAASTPATPNSGSRRLWSSRSLARTDHGRALGDAVVKSYISTPQTLTEVYEPGVSEVKLMTGYTDMICMARAEDSRFLIANLLHGLVHTCFCHAIFTEETTFERNDRWAWGFESSYVATRSD
eukprot:NODE_4711_length_647_cov_291.689189.p2 GENE.NODE_4711_length_647_cov_291.689189~~NODE_4711_length_647_cov_291.689189.p2  ORF type:complete len:130 (+),score=13.62 NODE_4711_length_647_cov_291.689189:148-537(+)